MTAAAPAERATLRSILRWPSKLEWRIAQRYLRSRRTSRVASLNTVISTGGVAVGVMALIVVLGVMNGLRNDLRERILVANPHLRILTFGAGLRIDDWRKALEVVKNRHVRPGEQPRLIRDLAVEAIDYLNANDLVTVPPLAVTSFVETQLSGVPAMIVAVESASKATTVPAAGCTMTTALTVHKESRTISARNVTRVFMVVDGVCFLCRQISDTKQARIASCLKSSR